jgi:hypothetical protein
MHVHGLCPRVTCLVPSGHCVRSAPGLVRGTCMYVRHACTSTTSLMPDGCSTSVPTSAYHHPYDERPKHYVELSGSHTTCVAAVTEAQGGPYVCEVCTHRRRHVWWRGEVDWLIRCRLTQYLQDTINSRVRARRVHTEGNHEPAG